MPRYLLTSLLVHNKITIIPFHSPWFLLKIVVKREGCRENFAAIRARFGCDLNLANRVLLITVGDLFSLINNSSSADKQFFTDTSFVITIWQFISCMLFVGS